MSSIAFLTLIVLVMAFPGYILRASYYADTFTRRILPKSWTDDIARAVLYSLPLHFFWLSIAECLQHYRFIHVPLNFEMVYRVLVGDYGDILPSVAQGFYQSKLHIGAYYTIVLVSAFVIGHLSRLAVWNWKLDVTIPWLFRFNNEWLYTLMGRDVPIPAHYAGGKIYVEINALTKIPSEDKDKFRLYKGFVEGFSTEENGALRDIFIKDAQRGKFVTEEGKKPVFEWKPVKPGQLMILKYSELQNLNITYLLELPQSAADHSSPLPQPQQQTASTQHAQTE